MESILQELYLGNIGFDSGRYEPNSPFSQAAKKKRDNMERLSATLDETEQELFEQYCDAEGDRRASPATTPTPMRSSLESC